MLYKTLFTQGLDFETYLKQGTEDETQAVNKVADQLSEAVLPETLVQQLSAIKKDVHLLIVGEMWCPDCQLNITAIKYMALLQPKIKLSIISKETAKQQLMELMELSQIKIPLVAMLNEQYQLVNSFIERPQTVISVEDFDRIKSDYFAGKYLLATISEISRKLAV